MRIANPNKNKNMTGENNPRYGKTASPELRKRLSISHLGASNKNKEKTNKEIFGLEKAKELQLKNRNAHLSKKNPYSIETTRKNKEANSGREVICHPTIYGYKRIKREKLQEFLDNGWQLGKFIKLI